MKIWTDIWLTSLREAEICVYISLFSDNEDELINSWWKSLIAALLCPSVSDIFKMYGGIIRP